MPLTAEQALKALARYDPDYRCFAAALPPEIAQMEAELPASLLEDALSFLRAERPELAAWLDAQKDSPPAGAFMAEPLAVVGTMTAVLFLLRSHITIERTPDKKWRFLFDHPAEESELLQKVFDKLMEFVSGIGGKR